MDPTRYARDLALDEVDNAHTLGVLLTPGGSKVLDIGTADGGLVRALTSRGCRVWGVEIDAEMAAKAAPDCEKLVVGNVEGMDLAAELGERDFDVVLLLDVLEHLVDPAPVLRAAAELLAPGGRVITSIPNVTHAAVRLHLLDGEFRYGETGLLDRTHLRFFDRAGVTELFETAGVPVLEQLRVSKPVDGTEVEVNLDKVPAEVLADVSAHQDGLIYQFVWVGGRPGSAPHRHADGSLSERLMDLLVDAKAAVESGRSYADALEAQIAAKDEQEAKVKLFVADLEARASELEATLTDRVEQLTTAREQLQALKRDVVIKGEQIARLQGQPPAVQAARRLVPAARAEVGAVIRANPGAYALAKRVRTWLRSRRGA